MNTERVEIYYCKQPFTVTGDRLEGTPAEIRDAGSELMALFRKVAANLPESDSGNPEIDEDEPPVQLDDRGLAV